MSTPKGTAPWNKGLGKGWTDKRGYRWRTMEAFALMREQLRREREIKTDLLSALKECRDAIAAAMRVIHGIDLATSLGLAAENHEQRFVDEVHAVGISDGFGVRADAAIAKAEGR